MAETKMEFLHRRVFDEAWLFKRPPPPPPNFIRKMRSSHSSHKSCVQCTVHVQLSCLRPFSTPVLTRLTQAWKSSGVEIGLRRCFFVCLFLFVFYLPELSLLFLVNMIAETFPHSDTEFRQKSGTI